MGAARSIPFALRRPNGRAAGVLLHPASCAPATGWWLTHGSRRQWRHACRLDWLSHGRRRRRLTLCPSLTRFPSIFSSPDTLHGTRHGVQCISTTTTAGLPIWCYATYVAANDAVANDADVHAIRNARRGAWRLAYHSVCSDGAPSARDATAATPTSSTTGGGTSAKDCPTT